MVGCVGRFIPLGLPRCKWHLRALAAKQGALLRDQKVEKMSEEQDREGGQRKNEGLEMKQDYSQMMFTELTMFGFESFFPIMMSV